MNNGDKPNKKSSMTDASADAVCKPHTGVTDNISKGANIKKTVEAADDTKLDNMSVITCGTCSSDRAHLEHDTFAGGRKPPRSSFLAEMPGQKSANTSLVLSFGEKGKRTEQF